MKESTLYQYLTQQTNLSQKDLLDTIHKNEYKRYHIQQGKKYRQIEEPQEDLATIQKALLPLLEAFPLQPYCIGGRKGYSTKQNGEIHYMARHLLKVDISGCYQSITDKHVAAALFSFPSLSGVVKPIIKICMLNSLHGYFLPTGAPTSPILCNIALSPIDEMIFGVVNPLGYRYTRYLDDMAISTTEEQCDKRLINTIYDILHSFSLRPNKHKSGWLKLGKDKLCITGINLAHRSGAPRVLRREMRVRLHHLAQQQQELDAETKGYLAYIHGIDPDLYRSLMEYWADRKARYGSSQPISSSIE